MIDWIETPEYWDTDTLYQNMNSPEVWDSLVELLEINPDHKVLHVASGAGNIACVMAKYVESGRIYALDFSRGSHKKLKEKIEHPEINTGLYIFYGLNVTGIAELLERKYNISMMELMFATKREESVLELLNKLSKIKETQKAAEYFKKDYEARKKHGDKIIIELGDAGNIKHPDGFFDSSFTFESIPILDGGTNGKWVSEMARVTKSGGKIVIAGFGIRKEHLKALENAGCEIEFFGTKELGFPFWKKIKVPYGMILIAWKK